DGPLERILEPGDRPAGRRCAAAGRGKKRSRVTAAFAAQSILVSGATVGQSGALLEPERTQPSTSESHEGGGPSLSFSMPPYCDAVAVPDGRGRGVGQLRRPFPIGTPHRYGAHFTTISELAPGIPKKAVLPGEGDRVRDVRPRCGRSIPTHLEG